MTAHYLAMDTYRDQGRATRCSCTRRRAGSGCCWCSSRRRRARACSATVGTPEKAALAKDAGAAETILYRETDFAEAVKALTDGRGVQAVYDSVGKTTFDQSLDCLAVRGTLALFGQSSGSVPPIDPARLAAKSLFLTRPTLWSYTVTRDELLARARDVFELDRERRPEAAHPPRAAARGRGGRAPDAGSARDGRKAAARALAVAARAAALPPLPPRWPRPPPLRSLRAGPPGPEGPRPPWPAPPSAARRPVRVRPRRVRARHPAGRCPCPAPCPRPPACGAAGAALPRAAASRWPSGISSFSFGRFV